MHELAASSEFDAELRHNGQRPTKNKIARRQSIVSPQRMKQLQRATSGNRVDGHRQVAAWFSRTTVNASEMTWFGGHASQKKASTQHGEMQGGSPKSVRIGGDATVGSGLKCNCKLQMMPPRREHQQHQRKDQVQRWNEDLAHTECMSVRLEPGLRHRAEVLTVATQNATTRRPAQCMRLQRERKAGNR